MSTDSAYQPDLSNPANSAYPDQTSPAPAYPDQSATAGSYQTASPAPAAPQPAVVYPAASYQVVQPVVPAVQLVAAPSNGLATGGFVCGLVGFVLGFVPFIWVAAIVLVVVGLILSAVGIARAGKIGGTGRGLGIAGLVICLAALLPIILVGSAVASMF